MRGASVLAVLAGLLTAPTAAAPAQAAVASTGAVCRAMTTPIFQTDKPAPGGSLLTRWENESLQSTTRYGYTQNRGRVFQAGSAALSGTTAVHRLYKSGVNDFRWSLDAAVRSTLKAQGYVDQGVNFYATAGQVDTCQVAVDEYADATGRNHRVAVRGSALAASLVTQRWSRVGTPFWTARATTPATSAPAPAPAPAPGPAPAPAPAPGAAGPVTTTTTTAGLDPEGTRIPDTAYPIPAGAVFMSPQGNDGNRGTTVAAPVRTLNRAIDLVPAGGTIVLRGGTYRDAATDGGAARITAKALTLQAYPHEQPWLDGSDVVSADRFVKRGAGWATPWSTPTFCAGRYYEREPLAQKSDNSGPCAHRDFAVVGAGDTLPSDPQQAFIDGVPQTQVAHASSLRPGTFYYDWSARTLQLGTDPAGRRVELTARPKALILGTTSGSGVSWALKGIGVRRYGSNPNDGISAGAVYVGNGRTTVENSVFTANAAAGLVFSTPQPTTRVSRSVFAWNGDTPLGANGDSRAGRDSDFTVANNVFNRNVWEDLGVDCTISCGQAAVKLAHLQKFTLTGNLVQNSGGNAIGLWCDSLCRNGTYTYNTIRDIGGIGIFHEVSDTGLIAGNVIDGASAGIQVTSANTKVYHNTLLHIREDVPIRVYDDARTQGLFGMTDVGPDVRNVELKYNVIAESDHMAYAVNPDGTYRAAANTLPAAYFSAFDDNLVVSRADANPLFMAWRSDLAAPVAYFRAADRARFSASFRGYESRSTWRIGALDSVMPRAARGDYTLATGAPGVRLAGALPADVARALGVTTTSTRYLGALPAPRG
ncbi:hypothetical protein GCM10011512_01070 [Tersicoccus solisilvae]|uniref:Right handed beta helix domain-containing protein n=1 Tax=Tersicoccus solisilvae TaxID=1882339 RepID=A0ABQ1NLF4_9MICC|nr:hypothetical protein GCM10011512_01070 [Tersicoccus solisilvae]